MVVSKPKYMPSHRLSNISRNEYSLSSASGYGYPFKDTIDASLCEEYNIPFSGNSYEDWYPMDNVTLNVSISTIHIVPLNITAIRYLNRSFKECCELGSATYRGGVAVYV